MSRFIDMDKLVLPKGTVDEIQKKGVPAILDWLAEQESIEIVRCKDCEWYQNGYCDNVNGLLGMLMDNDFCSFGERKETNE